MIFRQILHPQTGCASYVFGCTGKAKLAVVDPHIEHIEDYLAVAQQANSPIAAIFETHVQADHLSGSAQLAAATNAPIYLHESAQVTFPFTPLKDGDVVELGNDYVQVLHTPGHSADSISLVVGDRVRTEAPWLVFTGDTLFVGDVGRPDLHGDANTAMYAGQLYDSLFNKLLTLDDMVEVYPSHFSGSVCGRNMSGKPSSTIGFMLEMACQRNHTQIEAGRVELRLGNADRLPFDDATFDKAMTMNSLHIWPDPVAGLMEIRRVLRPGGRVAVAITRFSDASPDNFVQLLSDSGFTEVNTYTGDAGSCALGRA